MFGDQVKIGFKRTVIGCIAAGLSLMLNVGCKTEKGPDQILSEQEMVRVLIEIYVAEEKISASGLAYDSAKKRFPEVAAKIFEKLSVSDSAFRKSMEYYKANPKKLDNIYSTVIDSLNLKAQASLTKE